MITLRQNNLSLAVAPQAGGSIVYFRHATTSLLRETPAEALTNADASQFASFILMPFSNRVRNGQFTFQGTSHHLALDAKDPRNANHGPARFAPWQVLAQTAGQLRLGYQYTPGFPPGSTSRNWPFAFQAEQIFTLHPNGLHHTISLTNQHPHHAPAGIGLHPYFTRTPTTALQFSAPHVWQKDESNIPLHTTPTPPEWNFQTSRPLPDQLIDHAFSGWNGTALISGPVPLRLTAQGALRHLILYTPPQKPFFALEPVSHRPDALNPNHDPHDTGMHILAPGETLTGTLEISLACGQ